MCDMHDCDCHPKPSHTLIVEEAKVAMSQKLLDDSLVGFYLAPTAWIIEDEYGDFEHFQGNFENLTSERPVLNKMFADQLTGGINKIYERRQLDVWEFGEIKGNLINLSVFWSAKILPFLVKSSRFTVTMFTVAYIDDVISSSL